MKQIIKKIVGGRILNAYHLILAYIATLFYGFPSKKIIVIGVTGTKGKTSTANFIWSALTGCGIKTGIISTANIRIGDEEKVNDFHMTMPGRFSIQRHLKKMVDLGCECVVVEITSQGLAQNRHKGIDFDIAVFTNLTPEHIESHGNFENYKQAKSILFDILSRSKNKFFKGQEIKKTIIANADDDNADYFLSFKAEQKISFSVNKVSDMQAKNITEIEGKVNFLLNDKKIEISIPGQFNIWNALPGIAIAKVLNLNIDSAIAGIKKITNIPGRMEEIPCGLGFRVFVDYAHEKNSMTWAVKTARNLAGTNKVIMLLGAEGGGRDKIKRSDMGEIVGRDADYVVCSNVDPYEDDPFPIADDIAKVAEKFGKIREENLFVILDRREGIKKALSLAKRGDVVMFTGKGAEQTMILGGETIPWDDRKVVREEIELLNKIKK
ncbi:MAG: UDP-N-acetylmuramoyl-L-alanyl-D-glutamate--2,6-diaminopimelate ligase [Candidatus Paceibacterota bacterium]